MKKVIYYFSGTGNSLQVARKLSELLSDTAIHAISYTTEMDISAEVIGFIFPVYLWGVPDIIHQFLKKLNNGVHENYFFAVATYKSQSGDVIGHLQRLMRKQRISLSAGFTVKMPGNNIIFYDVESKQEQKSKLEECQSRLLEISQLIQSRKKVIPTVPIIDRFLYTGLLHSILISTFHNADRQFWIEPDCNSCGTCFKVCPVSNIILRDGKPEWQHNCQLCLTCINMCPRKVIQYGRTTKKRDRYMNPDIVVKDLYK